MSVHAILVGLDPAEAEAIGVTMARMHIQAYVIDTPADAKAVACRGDHHLAIVGYEGAGCGLPLAVSLAVQTDALPMLDCIVVADRMCPALGTAAKEMGLLAVLVRPVRPSALAAAVEAHLSRRMKRGCLGLVSKAIA